MRGQLVRELVAQRQLAQLGIAGVVVDPVDERAGRLDPADERGVVALRVDVLEAGLEHLAAGAQVVVGLLEAVLVVDQRVQPQPAAECEGRADPALGLGRRLAQKHARRDHVAGRVVAGHGLVVERRTAVAHHRREDGFAVRVELSAHHLLAEERCGGIAHAVLLTPDHDAAVLVDLRQAVARAIARRLTQVEHLVGVGGDVPVQVPGEVGRPHRLAPHVELDPEVPDRAGVNEHRVGEATGGRDVLRQDRVVRRLAIVGEVDADAIVQGAGLEAQLGAAAYLRAEVCVADELRRQHAAIARAGGRGVGLQRCEVVGLLARFAERPTQPHLVEPMEMPPRLFADHPAAAHLGIDLVAHLGAEGAVAVDAHCSGDEQAVVPGELLLHVPAQRVVLDQVLAGHGARRGRHGGEPRRREVLAIGLGGIAQPVVVLAAGRRDRAQPSGHRQVHGRVVVHRARGGITPTLITVARRRGGIEVLLEAVHQVRHELHVHLVGHVRAHDQPLCEP